MNRLNAAGKRMGAVAAMALAAAVWGVRPAAAQEPPDTADVEPDTAEVEPDTAAQAADAPAPEAVATPRQEKEHVVRRGDTLWDLASFYLEDPFLWPAIHEVNTDVVEDPHWIYPKERILIPGMPADRAAVAAEGARAAAGGGPEPRGLRPQPVNRTRFYTPPSPEMDDDPTVLEEDDTGTPAVVRAGEFRAAAVLADPDRLPVVARMVRGVEAGTLERVSLPPVNPYDEVSLEYADGPRPEQGDRLHLVRVDRRIRGWGNVIRPIATMTVVALESEVVIAEVDELFDRVRRGDAAIPLASLDISADAEPEPVRDGPAGRIVAFETEQPVYGTEEHAFLSIGRADDVRIGDELIAWLPERRDPRSPTLPEEPVAVLRVLRVTDRTATVRVLRLRHPVLEEGLAVRVVRRLP